MLDDSSLHVLVQLSANDLKSFEKFYSNTDGWKACEFAKVKGWRSSFWHVRAIFLHGRDREE